MLDDRESRFRDGRRLVEPASLGAHIAVNVPIKFVSAIQAFFSAQFVTAWALYPTPQLLTQLLRLSHALWKRPGSRAFITAFARNVVVTPSIALGIAPYIDGLARYCL